MGKKVFAIIGMVVSLAVVLCGILVNSGEMGGNTRFPGTAPYSYESGYASFGADFYTYVSNNAAEAADAAYAAAISAIGMAELMKNVFGWSMMGFGMLSFCFFGYLLCCCKKPEQVALVAPAPEAADEKWDMPEEAAPEMS